MIIAVIDTETAGNKGHWNGDKVVDIGVSLVDTKKRTVHPFFASIVGYDVDNWCYRLRKEWIFTHEGATLTLDDVRNAPSEEKVAEHLRKILKDYPLTSFNVAYDFDKFLVHEPWDLGKNLKAPDIMVCADKVEEIPRTKRNATGWRSWPKLDATYEYLCPDDPAGIKGHQDHRALSDTIVAGYVLLSLVDRGLYEVEE